MKVNLITVAYNALTEEVVRSALACDYQVELIIFTHSNNRRIDTLVHELNDTIPQITLKDYRQNRGLAKTWNEGIMMSEEADAIIIFNDDIVFSSGDLDKMIEASLSAEGKFVVTAAGRNESLDTWIISHGMACFAIQRAAIETVGYFDQNFIPAYFEDNDYWRRCTLAGLGDLKVTDTQIVHQGSYTIRHDLDLKNQNYETFVQNQQYYYRKWGEGPHKEVFEVPFNNPQFDLVIPKERVGAPYGSYDRPQPRLTRLI